MASVGRVAAAVALASACQGDGENGAPPRGDRTRLDTASIQETFVTPFDSIDNVDSPAVFHDGDTHWLLASAKSGNVVIVYDATTGAVVRRVGAAGSGPGQFRRPNGIAVADSLLFVVERDNRRVQVLGLPSFRSLGTFGDGLRNPYGIAWVRNGANAWRIWVTDNYETPEEAVPPDAELGQRIREFGVRLTSSGLDARVVRAFGDTAGDGVLRVVESIVADSASGRLLIAEEMETDSHIKVYDLDGRFTGQTVGRGFFPRQAEGIVLYACGDTAGYWIATDQGESVNTYHVFDRRSFDHLGSFTGAQTRLTDGVSLTQETFGPFPAGALFASHLDGAIAAMSWEAIARKLNLRADCR